MTELCAVVLVGGRSRRFGRDKLLEPVGGKPLIRHATDPLRDAFGAVNGVGSCDPRVEACLDRLIPDEQAGAGPLGALVSAMRTLASDILLVPGDVVGLDRVLIDRLREAHATFPQAGAFVIDTDRPQWALGIYQFIGLPDLEAVLRSGGSLGDAARKSGLKLIPALDICIRNINHPDDLADLR